MDKEYDLAFVGAGISTAYTILALLSRLEDQPNSGWPVHVLVIDRCTEFWAGVPYGSRAGINSLIISDVENFLPTDERNMFTDWLEHKKAALLADYAFKGGRTAAEWLDRHSVELKRGRWAQLYIPRYFFGRYISERVSIALAEATRRGTVRCDLRQTEVESVNDTGRSYCIETKTACGSKSVYSSRRVVFAVGSPPRSEVIDAQTDNPINSDGYVRDSHTPGLDETIKRVAGRFRRLGPTHAKSREEARSDSHDVLIVGSNASALETVYNLSASDAVADRIGRMYVISPSGEPEHWTSSHDPDVAFDPTHLKQLAAGSPLTAASILGAASADVEQAVADGVSIADTVAPISRSAIALLDSLSSAEQMAFVTTYGMRLGRIQRRSGGDYQIRARNLISEGRLVFIRGSLTSVSDDSDGYAHFSYSDGDSERPFESSVAAIINCTGFENVTSSSSPLIQELVQGRICRPTPSDHGFVVGQDYACSRDAYVIGPLLAGNLNGSMRIWHAESCWRLHDNALQLATVLAQRINSRVGTQYNAEPDLARPNDHAFVQSAD